MKFILFIPALLAVFPVADWLRKNPHRHGKIWVLFGIMSWTMSLGPHPMYIALISWAQWPSYVKGTEVSLLDLLALAIYLSQPRTRNPLPFKFSMALYFFAALLSILNAQVPMAAFFYVWQLARMFLIYAVVTRACSDQRTVPSLLAGLGIGLSIQAGFAIWDRFAEGTLQTGGAVGDKNLLGMMSHFTFLPWFALLLAGQRGKLAFITPLAGALVTILTVSRAALGLNTIALALTFVLSAFRQWTKRKALVAMACLVAAAVLAPLAISSFQDRFGEQNTTGYDERAAFEAAADMIISDHPMGIGANNYVVVANIGGYDDRAGVAWNYGSRATSVHNTYLLVTAETGYIGLITFILMLLRPITVAFACGLRSRGDVRGDLLLGLGGALFAAYIHSYFEWIFVTFQSQYMLAIAVGLIAGTAQQLGYWRQTSKIQVSSAETARAPALKLPAFSRKVVQ